ncbi:nuclear transport factor 2 family protein [Nocardia sp. NBC_01499]|uniref:nuclear transport factor 2 family protein n=1 Tax=Nocardia sp. NBC_01499 TaxID=2903597 RepID=UPI00386D6E0D
MSSKDIVVQATRDLFVHKLPDAVDRWTSTDYRQHNPWVADGPDGLRQFLATQPDGFGYQLARVIADGDMVALHGVYRDTRFGSLVAFDVFRLEEGKLAEHWDALQPVVDWTVGGRTQVDGRIRVTAPERTEATRKIVIGFVETVLMGRQVERLPEFVSSERYAEHNPFRDDGIDGLRAAIEDGGMVQDPHFALAEGEFALTMGEYVKDGERILAYDLFRVEGDKIVEHWDVVGKVPPTSAHGNGLF